MVDKDRREKLALYMRHFASGQISREEFETQVMNDVTFGWPPEQFYRSKESENDDLAIRAIIEYSWCLYNDPVAKKLNGKYKLSSTQREEMERFVIFLHSNYEYDWDFVDLKNPTLRFSFTDILKSILTLGKHYKSFKLKKEDEFILMKKSGDFEYWPFKTKTDYERQLKIQSFLHYMNCQEKPSIRKKNNKNREV